VTTERQHTITVQHACDLVERALDGDVRRQILERAMGAGGFVRGLRRLRMGMRSHTFETPDGPLALDRVVEELDRRTRGDGFHVLQAWDYGAQRFSDENVGVLMLDHCVASGFLQREEPVALAILLDYYFLHLLGLCVLRAWDGPDPGRVLDRVTALIGRLQGPCGSGQRFVDDAETLLMLAISHFHPEETAYDRLIGQVRTLDERSRTRFALVSAAVLGSHLRWGSAVMYRRDLVRMRRDNVGDYPWLLFSLVTLMRAYVDMRESPEVGMELPQVGPESPQVGVKSTEDRAHATTGAGEDPGPPHALTLRNVVASLLNGLSPDPWAFVEKPPVALAGHADRHAELRALLARHGGDLLAEWQAHRPAGDDFSPLAFHFNFPNNALVATVTVALLQGKPQPLSLNALLMGEYAQAGDAPLDLRGIIAKTLMYYSASSPDRLGQSGEMLIVYDPQIAIRHYNQTLAALKKHVAAEPPG